MDWLIFIMRTELRLVLFELSTVQQCRCGASWMQLAAGLLHDLVFNILDCGVNRASLPISDVSSASMRPNMIMLQKGNGLFILIEGTNDPIEQFGWAYFCCPAEHLEHSQLYQSQLPLADMTSHLLI